MGKTDRIAGDNAVSRWFATQPGLCAAPGAADAAA